MKETKKSFHATMKAGFTLVELAIVIVIAALLLSAAAGYLKNAMKVGKQTTTEARIADIEKALKAYVTRNNKLPRPASRTIAANDAGYATEITGTTAAGVTTVGTGANMVLIGMVPTRTLNLPDEYGYDAWGARILYAMTNVLNDTTTTGTGAISIRDHTGASLITPANQGSFVLASHGPDRQGGFSAQGIQMEPCGTTDTDRENCDNDAIFVNTMASSDGTNQFDDIVYYEGNFNTATGIPTGAIMAFDLDTCPAGWNPMPDMAGRTIVGTGSYTETTTPPTAPLSGYTRNYARDDAGGNAMRIANGFSTHVQNMPPYKAYLYCIKG